MLKQTLLIVASILLVVVALAIPSILALVLVYPAWLCLKKAYHCFPQRSDAHGRREH